MIRVITYGTFDMLHFGHVRLLERAKALGDYLIVGVTSDDYDKTRGKINNQQTLMERIAAVKKTGLADEIIIEEYEGQKIDDIRKRGIDIFTVGSDWEGKFDYLKEYCRVVYLPRTEGISSSSVRTQNRRMRLGIVGDAGFRPKIMAETAFVNGIELTGIYPAGKGNAAGVWEAESEEALLEQTDGVYILSHPTEHARDVRKALEAGNHVLCESPITLTKQETTELFNLAKEKNLILMDAIKTAYSTAFERMVLLTKTGKIGHVVSVDAVCTSLKDGIMEEGQDLTRKWNSICAWGPTGLLPVFQILGTNWIQKSIKTCLLDVPGKMDIYTKIDFVFEKAVASVRVGKGAKAEGELIVTGTEGYIFVPAPWWKTDYFELRYENASENRRFFYQLEGEGIRNEIVAFAKAVENAKNGGNVSRTESEHISAVIEAFETGEDVTEIQKWS